MNCDVVKHEIDLNVELHTMSDEGLIAAAQSGHERAFVELCTRSEKRAFSTIYSVTKNRALPPGSPGLASTLRS
jgi:hypothetical protein